MSCPAELPAVVDLARAFASFDERWSPRIAGQVNDMLVKLAKLEGEFVWHHHEREDELFLVIKGRLTMRLPGGERVLEPGQFLVVPRGVEHCPMAAEECWVVLFEPATTLNTGNVEDQRTRRELERLA